MAGVMRDEELDLLHNAELKEAFDEFDKVEIVVTLTRRVIRAQTKKALESLTGSWSLGS